MAMQPIRSAPSLETAPLGVRTIAFVVRHFGLLAIVTILLTAGGVVLGVTLPRPFVDRAMVELGLRFLDEPVEHPMIAAARLTGYLQAAARETGEPGARIFVENRRGQKQNELTRLIEVRVQASTADAARAIVDRAVGRLVEEHREVQKEELAIMKRQLAQLEAASEQLEAQVDKGGEEADELAPLVFTIHRKVNATRSVTTQLRIPPSRVVRHALQPARARSKLPVTTLAGLVLGVIVGVIAGAWRDAKRSLK